MSVPKNERTENKLQALKETLDMVKYTIQMCENEKILPKKARWNLCSRIIDNCLDIVAKVRQANRIDASALVIGVDINSITSAADFKSYLAQQYANGTPVCVWYVLAEPTTGIVNEPLRKIGDYADTLSMEQAGVSIPTNNGSTTVDVDTTLKPSEVYIKYKGR